jgi:hypothetical protein
VVPRSWGHVAFPARVSFGACSTLDTTPPFQHTVSQEVEAQGRRTTDEPIPGDTQRGVVEGDVQDFYGATAVVMEEQHRRRVACVTGELEPWLAAQGAPGLDAQGVGHAHTAAAGRAAGHPNCILAGGHRCASHHDKPQPYECRRRKKWWPR